MAYAAVNGLQLYYERMFSGRPLVLLHGGLMTIDLNFGPMPRTTRSEQAQVAINPSTWNSMATGHPRHRPAR